MSAMDAMMSMNLYNIVILNVCGVDYCCISDGTSKSETVYSLQSANISKKMQHYRVRGFFTKL